MAYKLNDEVIVGCLFDSDAEISDFPSDNNRYVDDSDVDPDFLPSPSVLEEKKMTEAVVSGKDTRGLFINNSDDLLTLKKVISKKTDEDIEKQKLNESVETIGSELNGNHNKADTIHVDVDNTSSLEPNIEMDTDHNITISSICTQEDQESETNYNSNENPIEDNQADLNNSKKDIQVNSIKSLDVPYSLSDPLYNNDSRDFEDDYSEFNNIASPASSFNISARAPLPSYNDLDGKFEDDNFSLEKELLYNKRKRKFEDLAEQKKVLSKKTDEDIEKQKLNESVETNASELNGNHNKADTINVDVDNTSSLEPNIEMDSDTDQKFEDLAEQDQKSNKIRKLWRWMKYPFQKKTYRTSISEDELNISIAEIIVEKENSIEPKSAVCVNNRNSAKTEEKNTQNSFESDDEIQENPCNIM